VDLGRGFQGSDRHLALSRAVMGGSKGPTSQWRPAARRRAGSSGHKARLVGNRVELRGGQICGFAGREETDEANTHTFVLDLGTKVWSCAN
jgi:hypothetical protein